MKRLLSAFILLAGSLLAFTACDEMETAAEISIPDAASQELFNRGIRFSATPAEEGLTATVSFTTTLEWTATVEDADPTKAPSWLIVSPASGQAGPAEITITAEENKDEQERRAIVLIACGEVSQSLKVTQAGAIPVQPVPAESIQLNIRDTEMKVGETLQLIATVAPENSTDKVVWASLMEENATVEDGLVTALKEGFASITATAGNVQATCRIAIRKADDNMEVTSITLDQPEIHMSPGQTVQITATVEPEEAAGSVSWSSSHTNVATVDQEGKVTAVALGETVITASAGDKSAECLVKVEEEVAITGISLNETALTLKEGETFQLVATLLPETATPKPIEWVSSIPAVATVDENGLVTAVRKGGPASIWAIVNRGTYLETAVKCEVTVTGDAPAIESITVTPAKVSINYGEETVLTATVKPEGADVVIQWFSDNTDMATVEKISDTQAKVTGVGTGTTKVVAYVGDVFDYSEVTVNKGSSGGNVSVTLNKTELQLGFCETAQLTATLVPEDASAEITWSSSDESVAIVSNGSTYGADGSIMPAGMVMSKNKEGEAIITAKVGDSAATCKVTVRNNTVSVTGITLDKTTLEMNIGETAQLTATVLPENATDKTVTWSSTNDRVASVSNGLVVAQSAGEAVITAKAGNATATCTVVVGSGSGGSTTVESASVNPSSVTLQLNEEQVLTLVTVPADVEVTIWWESANQYIANVQMISKMQAKVTGVSVGQTTITVHAGDKTATCAVTVSDDTGTSVPVESVSLNVHELTMNVNTQYQLVATVLPENATNKEVVWSSSAKSSQLYIDTNGLVSALAECEATITVRCKANAYIYDTCKITVTGGGSSGSEEAVDLGLPSGLKWGSMNVGASKPEDYGNYYAWGETSTKSSYTWSNYKFGHSQNGSFTKYDSGVGTDNKSVLDPEDDAATVNLGGGWRTPTRKEWKELYEQCTWTWKTRNGVNGMQVTGPNGNSIFLPAGGWYDSTISNRGTYGSYWTASLAGIQGMASTLDFISSAVENTAAYARCQGKTVRPVMD